MKIEYLKLEEITPYDRNPRKNDAAIELVRKSIDEFGFDNKLIERLAAPNMCTCPKCGKQFMKV